MGGRAVAQNHAVGGRGTVISTSDLGKTWKVRQFGTQDYQAIRRLNKDTIFVAGGTEIRRTGNGFDTLGLVRSRGQVGFRDIAIFPSGRGFAAQDVFFAHPINAQRSTNGGASWFDENNNLGLNFGMDQAKGTETAFSLHSDGRGIFKSTNGGVSWNNTFSIPSLRSVEQTRSRVIMVGDAGRAFSSAIGATRMSPLPLPSSPNVRLNRVRVSPDDSTVIVVGNNGYAARSTDGGLTWAQISITTSNLNFVTWANAHTVFVGADEDTQEIPLFKSTDAGLTWNRIPLTAFVGRAKFTKNNFTLDMRDSLYGIMASGWRGNGNENALYKTTNGGTTWTELTGPYDNRNASVVHILSTDSVLVSHFGTFGSGEIFLSTDGGVNFRYVGADRAGKYGKYFTSRNVGYICGEIGIWGTTNGGAAWTQVADPRIQTPMYDINKGYVVGAFGKAFRTTDYVNYTELAPLGFIAGTFRDVQVVNQDTAYVVGDRASVFRTWNGGSSWSYLGDTLKTTNYKAVHFTSAARGWAVANAGVVANTADSGRTWSERTVTTGNLNDVYFLDENVGVIVGDSGYVITTADAGANWTRVYVGTRQNINRAWLGDTLNQPTNKTISFMADTAMGFAGEVVSVPVTAKDFNKIRSFQGALRWDTAVARYVTVSQFRVPALALRNFNNSTAATQGELRFSWNTNTPVTLPDNDTLFMVSFRLKAAASTVSDVRFEGRWQAGAVDSMSLTVPTNTTAGQLIVKSSPNLVTLNTLVRGAVDSVVCAGGTLRVPYFVSEAFPAGNEFRVQVSDTFGNFATPVFTSAAVVGRNSDTLTVTIPANLRPSAKYRIRVVASLPVVQGSAAASFLVVAPIPARPTITAGGPLAICPGDSLQLTAPAGFAVYAWNNGANTQSTFVRGAGQWNVTVTSAAGCVSQVSANTTTTAGTRPSAPTITATGSTTRCEGDSVTLSAPSANAYLWSTGATSRTIVVKTAGAYTVQTRTTATGCFSVVSNATNVTFNPVPDTANITITGPSNDSLVASTVGTSYIWYLNGNRVGSLTTQKVKWTAAGNWTVQVVSAGCTSVISPAVTVVFLAGNALAGQMQVYPNPSNGEFTLNLAGIPAQELKAVVTDLAGRALHTETVHLSNGATTQTLNLNGFSAGTYLLRLQNEGGQAKTTKLVIR